MEEEQEGVLPFLDTQLHRGREGTLDVTVFQKKTHTDRYLQFDSHHPMHVKRGVVKSLFDRAQAVTLEEENMCFRRGTPGRSSAGKWLSETIHPEVPGKATTTR